jgi:hypothetical protein
MTPAAALLVHLGSQDGASAPRFRKGVAFRPRRLESCQIPRKPRADGLRSSGSTRSEAVTHRFARLAPRPPVKEASARAELDPPATRASRLRASANQRCFRSTPASYVFKDQHPGIVWLSALPEDCRRNNRFTAAVPLWLAPLVRVAFLAPVTRSRNQPLTPTSPVGSSAETGPANQPASVPQAPRERNQLPRHRASDADEDSRKNPLQPMQPTRSTGTPCERLLLTRIAISGFLASSHRTRKHGHWIVSGTPRNRSSEATSKTPSAPVEVARVSMHAAAQRPTRTPSDTPLSSFRPTPGLES